MLPRVMPKLNPLIPPQAIPRAVPTPSSWEASPTTRVSLRIAHLPLASLPLPSLIPLILLLQAKAISLPRTPHTLALGVTVTPILMGAPIKQLSPEAAILTAVVIGTIPYPVQQAPLTLGAAIVLFASLVPLH